MKEIFCFKIYGHNQTCGFRSATYDGAALLGAKRMFGNHKGLQVERVSGEPNEPGHYRAFIPNEDGARQKVGNEFFVKQAA